MEAILRKISTSELRDDVSTLVSEAAYGSERFVVTRHGKEVAALVPAADLQLLQELERLVDVEATKEALKQRGETTSLKKLKEELDL